MKFKHVITTFALAGLLGAGALVGAKAMQAKETKADGVPSQLYFNWTNSAWASWGADISDMFAYFYDGNTATGSSWHGNKAASTVTVDSINYCVFDVPTGSTGVVFNFVHEGWDENDWSHQTHDQVIPTDGKNCFTLGEQDNYKFKGTWSTFGGLQYTVTEYGVYDGVLDTENPLGTTKVDSKSSHDVPAAVHVSGYHFEGWYSDATCTTKYTGTESVTSNFAIYAKYTQLVVDSYIYWISESNTPVFDKFYAFGEYNVNPAVSIADYEVSGVLTFNGLSQKIYKIPVPSNADFQFILLTGEWAKQTYDIDVTPGAGYYTWLESGQTKYSWSVNVDAGAALDLLLAVEAKRNAVVASEGILDYSVCGISAQDAADLYNAYFALSEGAKTMVDKSSTYTYNGAYDGETVPGESNQSYAAIMAQLKQIALDGGKVVNGSNSINSFNNDTVVITVVIAVAALISMGGLFLLIKRRKQLD